MSGESRRLDSPPAVELYRQAVAALDRARDLPPLELTREADEAERAVAKLRDELIAVLRRDGGLPETSRLRRALERVNVALSLIVGVEYPAAGIHRQMLAQARQLLRDAEMLESINPG